MQLPAHTDISDGCPADAVISFGLIDNELGQVKELIREQLTGCGEPISRLTAHLKKCAGKMIRPGLVLLSYRAVCDTASDKKGRCDKGNRQREAVRVAAVMELIHNATLLHDDVIDEGQRRRGLPTVNNLWGNEPAVLLGDFLLSQVFGMCAGLQPELQRIIATATARTCEGELSQIIQRRNWHLSEPQYIRIITEKSAALFGSCCQLGGLLARGSESQVRSLTDFGHNVGIAFQIIDDLLDIVGDESKTGKTLGNDVDKDNLTLAVIHLLRQLNEGQKDALIRTLNTSGESRKPLVGILRAQGSLEYARDMAHSYVVKAIASLAGLDESDAKTALIETAKFVGRRAI